MTVQVLVRKEVAKVASPLKLTAMAKAAGCAAKLNPATLEAVLRKLPRQTNPNVLVGFETNDDAGVYLVNENLSLVQTVDFFTPIIDDEVRRILRHRWASHPYRRHNIMLRRNGNSAPKEILAQRGSPAR